jgi:hypothetical protein
MSNYGINSGTIVPMRRYFSYRNASGKTEASLLIHTPGFDTEIMDAFWEYGFLCLI